MKKKLSILTPCYNELENVEPLHRAIEAVMEEHLPEYDYEQIYIDNCSTDGTDRKLRALAARDPRVKVIFNVRNFGHIRSPYHGMMQASGDAVICMASDFQDPPELIPQFVKRWEEGFKIALAVKKKSQESPLFFFVRRSYYRVLGRLSEVKMVENATGFGIYDREVVNTIRTVDDPYPYVRGLISELGYEIATIPFTQPTRQRGITKNNFYTLYDIAMLGLTKHSKVPLRLATMMGLALSAMSLLMGLGYLVYKLLFWERFSTGVAPVVIGLFLFASVQLFFIGLLGEYIGVILTQVRKLPHVIERERLNFAASEPGSAAPEVRTPGAFSRDPSLARAA